MPKRSDYISPEATQIDVATAFDVDADLVQKGRVEAYYFDTKSGRPAAIVFFGRKQKPSLFVAYPDPEVRESQVRKRVVSYIDDLRIKQARQQAPMKVVEGDIMVASWGWEQTNVDYFQVVGVAGKRTVILRPIGAVKKRDGRQLTGVSVPVPGQFEGPAFRRRVTDRDNVRIDDGRDARLVERTAEGGIKAATFTEYA
ncbi:MAG: hypothetical protein LAT62_13405 [Natronospirillum sp.]|uniref:hypothetical protein n=1 Tax=Natronospirillum sp. TaxID=2812955 RepID=UPI0025F36CD9|nr:hypothetical protein [Natronospirillum sp.]MCH8552930.1 hypothetical protein [Natronospirillum sp.]